MSDACGKVPFSSPTVAWRVITAFTKPEHWLKHKEVERPTRAYRCPQCHCWHVTHYNPIRKPRPEPKPWRWPTRSALQ